MAKNKIVYFGETLLDLSNDTVTEATMLVGSSAHNRAGEIINGACTFDADTSDANATAAEILSGTTQNPITAYVNGVKVTGTMPDNGGANVEITTLAGTTIPRGYSDGSAKAILSATEIAKIVGTNIRQGVTILGVQGEMTGTEDVSAQTKTITPSSIAQTVVPDTGYNYLSEVIVAAIPYVETANQYGTTVTIG